MRSPRPLASYLATAALVLGVLVTALAPGFAHAAGGEDAAHATRHYLKPRFAIPMHYGTNPMLKGTPEEYVQALGQSDTKVLALSPGEQVEF